MRHGARRASTAPATSCSRRAPRSDAVAARARASPPSGSAAGTAASTSRASPPRCATAALRPGEINVLYAGRLTQGEGRRPARRRVPRARARDPRLHLRARRRRARGGRAARAARRRARRSSAGSRARSSRGPTPSADVFLFASRTDTFGQVDARGAGQPGCRSSPSTEGGPRTLIEDGRTGLLCAARAEALGRRGLPSSPPRRVLRRAARARPRWRPCRRAHLGARARAARRGLRRARWRRTPAGAAAARGRGRLTGSVAAARRRGAAPACGSSDPPALRVVDVALFYGSAAAASAPTSTPRRRTRERTGAFEHHAGRPRRAERHDGGRARAARRARGGLQRLPRAARRRARCSRRSARARARRRAAARPVLGAARRAGSRPSEVGRAVVVVHHGSLDARRRGAARPGARLPAPRFRALAAPRLRARDGVMSACDPLRATPAGRRRCRCASGSTRRSGRDRRVPRAATTCSTPGGSAARRASFELLEAAARAREPWPLQLVGAGTGRARARRAGAPARPRRARAVPALESDRARARPRVRGAALRGHARRARDVRARRVRGGGQRRARRRVHAAPSARPRSASSRDTFAPATCDGLLAAIERAARCAGRDLRRARRARPDALDLGPRLRGRAARPGAR